MLKAPVFWLLYVMFVLVAGSGLMATAQIAPIALDFKLAGHEVTILFMTATTLSSALVFDNVLNGLARPFFGWISDVIGRENTMAIVFSFGALAYWGLSEFGHAPHMFIIMAGFIFFTWGEIFSLFPATCTDTFGARYELAASCSRRGYDHCLTWLGSPAASRSFSSCQTGLTILATGRSAPLIVHFPLFGKVKD